MEALLASSSGVAKLATGAAQASCRIVCPAPMLAPSRTSGFSTLASSRPLTSSASPNLNSFYTSASRGRLVTRAGVKYEAQGAARTLAPITVYTAADGKPVKFEDLWDQNDVILSATT